ncbi:MAG: hypothetical protein ABGZ17_23025, partial [Planctomycetaceae bacterium]
MNVHHLTLSVLLVTASTNGGFSDDKNQAKTPQNPVLCRGHYHSEAEAIKQLERMAATYANLEQWQARAKMIRRQILVGA